MLGLWLLAFLTHFGGLGKNIRIRFYGSYLTNYRSSFFTVVPTFVVSYLIYDSAEKEHDRLQRKQPGQFDHEV